MDDPFVGPNQPIRLRRSCERNRLEKQLLINAYETLVALIVPGEEITPEGAGLASAEGTDRKQAKLAELMKPAA